MQILENENNILQILERGQVLCQFWTNFTQHKFNKVAVFYDILGFMRLTAPICEKVNILCVSNISAILNKGVKFHCSSNGQFEKMYRVQIWRWETTSASIMESLFWRLQPQNADSLVLTTLLELLYVWSGDRGCHNIACCFFSSQSCILWAAFSPRDLVSGGACFLKCASWRITPLECLWEGESINPRQIFHLFRFSGSTLNWDYRFCHNHLSPKFGSILRSVILISSLLIKSTIC